MLGFEPGDMISSVMKCGNQQSALAQIMALAVRTLTQYFDLDLFRLIKIVGHTNSSFYVVMIFRFDFNISSVKMAL